MQLGIPLIDVSLRAAHKPAYDKGCGFLPEKFVTAPGYSVLYSQENVVTSWIRFCDTIICMNTAGASKLCAACRGHCNLTLRRLMSYIYGAPILDVSRSHTTTQHSR